MTKQELQAENTNKTDMNEKECKRIADLCIDALITDGGHHKQRYLELILAELLGKETVDRLKDAIGWEPSI